MQVFLQDIFSCLSPPVLPSGHLRRLQEEQVTLEQSVVGPTWNPEVKVHLEHLFCFVSHPVFLLLTRSNFTRLYAVGWSTEKFFQNEKSVCWWGKGNVATLVYFGEKALHKRGTLFMFPWVIQAGWVWQPGKCDPPTIYINQKLFV